MAKSLKDTLKLGPRVEFKKTDKNIEATENSRSGGCRTESSGTHC
jgi:hypothetical protein